MIKKVLIANRGEIAVRVIRACQELGLQTVIAHSEADRESLGVLLADQSICIGPGPSDKSYLNIANVVSAAQVTGADAIHPGYGFLAENTYLAEVCREVGITFIGPQPESIDLLSDKVNARNAMKAAGVPVVPGTDQPLLNVEAGLAAARDVGYPVMLKAVAGGGGRGMRVARDPDDFARLFPVAQMEAQANFGNGGLYVERLIERGRHIEIQVAGDHHGNVVHLGERECSIQRRHQKVVEEAPSPVVSPEKRAEIGAIAANAVRQIGYHNVGTMEFIVDQEGNFFFLEMNTRLQVEHPVTEFVTGVDVVKLQIHIANGEPLPFRQEDVRVRGHAIECRLVAEDPARNFAPDSGHIQTAHFPGGPWVRVDTHVFSGYTTPPYYDSLLAKIITWGGTRDEAIARMRRALAETQVEGVRTNLPYLSLLLSDPRFREAQFDVEFVDRHLAEIRTDANGPALLAGAGAR